MKKGAKILLISAVVLVVTVIVIILIRRRGKKVDIKNEYKNSAHDIPFYDFDGNIENFWVSGKDIDALIVPFGSAAVTKTDDNSGQTNQFYPVLGYISNGKRTRFNHKLYTLAKVLQF